MRRWILAAGLIPAGGMALAHAGVENPAVKARMDAMSDIGAGTKVLGNMARGRVAFDAAEAEAEAALARIATRAAETPALFEAQEDDPKSEALPAIWADFADFSAIAGDLRRAAEGGDASVKSDEFS